MRGTGFNFSLGEVSFRKTRGYRKRKANYRSRLQNRQISGSYVLETTSKKEPVDCRIPEGKITSTQRDKGGPYWPSVLRKSSKVGIGPPIVGNTV